MATNSESLGTPDAASALISALVDGDLEADAVAAACSHWRESAESQATWHAYHLIGDVLRSDDLACDPASDARFLADFRARLAKEPVVLAPQPLDAAAAISRASGFSAAVNGWRGAWSWGRPSALAAGIALVAGVIAFTRVPDTPPVGGGQASAELARIAPPSSERPLAAVASGGSNSEASLAEPPVFVANGKFIRDARLDRYLAAHKQFAGSSALGVPSAFLRNATADAGER